MRPAKGLFSLAESFVLMGTVVSIEAVGTGTAEAMHHDIGRALQAMRRVEEILTRFDETSPLRTLCRASGEDQVVPPILFHALKIAVQTAQLTDGVFDPTIGLTLEKLGFDRHYLTGERIHSDFADQRASYRDIWLVDDGMTVRLNRPMSLDLGAIAKGLAVDAAARALEHLDGFAINAGGDVFVYGVDPLGRDWSVGIEDPRHSSRLIASLRVQNMAVCTSASHKRRAPANPLAHHLLNARTGQSEDGVLSVTAMAPLAVLADVAATAAFLLGPSQAIAFLVGQGLEGLVLQADGHIEETPGMEAYRK